MMSGVVSCRHTLWMLAAYGVRYSSQAIYFVLVARALGPRGYGAFAAAVGLAAAIAPFGSMGSGNVLIKYVSRSPDRFAVCWGNALRTTVSAGLGLSALALLAGHLLLPTSVSRMVLLWVCLADILLSRLLDVAGQAYQAFERLARTALLQAMIAVVRLGAATALVVFDRLSGPAVWAFAYSVTSLVTALAGIGLAQRELGRPDFRGRFRGHLWEGFLFAMSLGSQNAYNDVDKTLVARFAGLQASGIYAAAYRGIDVAFSPVRALVYAAYPQFFRRGSEGVAASSRYGRALLVPATAYGALAAAAVWWGAPILTRILGGGFAETARALRWLAPLLVIRAVHYVGQDALTGADRQGVRTAIQLAIVGLNVAMCVILIPGLGWYGAALASIATESVLAIAIWTATLLLAHRQRSGAR